MKPHVLFATAAALALAGCGSKSEPAATVTEAASEPAAMPTAESAAAVAPASAEKGAKPDKAFMVGKWAEGGDCKTLVIDFKADGTMDGPVEKWNLEDGKLEMVGMPQKMHLTILDADTMESRIDGTGEPHTLKRCK
jgi:hypothetical protein